MAHATEQGDQGPSFGTSDAVENAGTSAQDVDRTEGATSGLVAPTKSTEAKGSASAEAGMKVACMPLESLTPNYVEGFHRTYLRRLEEAVKDPRNLNIALTGHYGAGKSSVLNRFQASYDKSVLRLAISTLAPGEGGESTTNRIQKELVKQLLYGASEKVGKNSRFTKIAVLGKGRAFAQSAAFVLAVGGLLFLFGLLPQIRWTGAHEATWVQVAAWAGGAVLATLLVSGVRLLTYGRFSVSDVSAGGAALTLTERPQSFFDKYLDEIVHFFGRESKDIVIFEDLDRFEDPYIFEALRELNTLLNETPERRRRRRGNAPGRAFRWILGRMKKEWPKQLAARLPYPWAGRLLGFGEPLRFIYAVRDSVFRKIDTDTATVAVHSVGHPSASPSSATDTGSATVPGGVDEAAAETLRANRTKFFDVVIPLVPFISHRNARDLLADLLRERGITGIEPRLVNTVARHCTDMRLMRNMCNEYLVFAERLLEPVEPHKTAPGMDESHLFALVAYKNFHLDDFEHITRRDSDLDRLYDFHQRLIRETIAARDLRTRALIKEPERFRARAPIANRLGERLNLYASTLLRASASRYGSQWSHYYFKVGTQKFAAEKATDYELWAAVAKTRNMDIVLSAQPSSGQTSVAATFDEDGVTMFAPEGLDADRWAELDDAANKRELADIECDINDLRRADLCDLAKMPRFTLTPQAHEAAAGDQPDPQTFAQLLTATLKSQLACELVRRGYIDRNFSLYAAQFYGNFTGIDVATFMVQHVQTNTMAIDYDLSRDGAAANLLTEAAEAGEELLHTVAAYNIDIVDHLLTTDHADVGNVANQLIAGWPGEDTRTFLAAYFTSRHAQRDKLAGLLAAFQWREVYKYLTTHDDVPSDARTAVVNAALGSFDPHATYDLDDGVREFITTNYRDMAVFAGPNPDGEARPSQAEAEHEAVPLPERLDEMLRLAGIVIPELRPLNDGIRERVVEANRYQLTAHNLRTALGIEGAVTLEVVMGNQTVFGYCMQSLPAYLAAVRHDVSTDYAVATPHALVAVLRELVSDGDDQIEPDPGNVAAVLAHTSPDARLGNIREAPQSTWTALAAAELFRASLANLESYRAHVGAIDSHIAALLQGAGSIDVSELSDTTDADGAEYDREAAAVAILNASVLAPGLRAQLVTSLGAATPLTVDDIVAEESDLFARLLEHGIVNDNETAFRHFRDGGWPALGPAIKVSVNITSFVTTDLLSGMVSDVLTDADTAAKVGPTVLGDVDGYVPDDDWAALQAVATNADSQRVPLTPHTVARIAMVGQKHRGVNASLVLRLLCAASPTASADDIINTFAQLGQPYSGITQPKATFDVDYDVTHDQLLKVLHSTGRITRGYPRVPRRRYSITVR